MRQFLEILFVDEIRPNDLEIILQTTHNEPGRAKLARARIGSPHPDAPNNSASPLFSQSGAKIGFVANVNLIETPFATTSLRDMKSLN